MHFFNRLKLSVCSRGIDQRLDRERGNRKGKKSKRPSFRFLQYLSRSLVRVATKVSWLVSRVHYEKRLFALPSEQARDKLLDSRMEIEDIHMHANAFQKQFSNLLEELNAFVLTKWEVPPKEFSHSLNDIPKPGSFGAKLFYNGLLMVSTRINAKNELDKRAQVHLAFLRGVFVRAAATPEQFEKLLNLSIIQSLCGSCIRSDACKISRNMRRRRFESLQFGYFGKKVNLCFAKIHTPMK